MILYRVFNWDGRAAGAQEGGPLFVPRMAQGQGRHDIPDRDGVLYTSLSALSAVAEWVQFFRTRELTSKHFELSDRSVKALATFELSAKVRLADFDDPETLLQCKIKPSQIITHDRNVTRRLTGRLFDEGHAGFLWPSSLEGSWINATLFQSRIQSHLALKGNIQPLKISMPEVLEASAFFDIDIEE